MPRLIHHLEVAALLVPLIAISLGLFILILRCTWIQR